ncbi:MAG: C25 family cysteine peptidase [Candidatus Cloacimonadaceae bacterium]|nr:C25 family cysteine peptidase [Candidatus Cloacimonadaceae bacterium]
MKIRQILFGIALFAVLGMTLSATERSETASLRIDSIESGRIVLKLDLPQLKIISEDIDGKSFDRVILEGAHSTDEDGMPEMPLITTMIAIPPSGGLRLSYTYGSFRTIPINTPKPVRADERNPLNTRYDELIRDGIEAFPQNLVNHSEPAWIRDFRVLQIAVQPVQYLPAQQLIRIYEDIVVTVEMDGAGGDYTSYSPSFANIYEAHIANFDTYRNLPLASPNARILIIHGQTNDNLFLQRLGDFVKWKKQKGYEVSVASTAVTGASNNLIKNYIQGQYNNTGTRPDFIILIGDVGGSYAVPTFYETISQYNGEGDYPYTHLAGGDLLGDAFIGRMSVENLSQFATMLAKGYAYEKNVNNNPAAAAWLDRVLLIGDPSDSGISCVYVSKYIRELARKANPSYSFIENYTGGYSTTMNSGINQGVGFFSYRGFWGVSGWSPSSSLVNGVKLPHSAVLTCGTGSFANGTSLSEAFMRLGTEAVAAGALTAIGIATTGTHTLYNNALSAGIFNGVFSYGMRSMGEALLSGKLFLYSIYSSNSINQANYFAHWCNLIGDPTLEAFVGIPENLNITAPNAIPLHQATIDIVIRDDDQMPVNGVSVTAYNNSHGDVVAKGITASDGTVYLNIPNFVSSDLIITASQHDFKPVQHTIAIDPNGSLVYFGKMTADDDSSGSQGNSDGFANAGETIALWVDVKNSTQTLKSGINAILSCFDEDISITQAVSSYQNLAPSGNAMNSLPYLFTINSNIPAFKEIRFVIVLTDAEDNTFSFNFRLPVYNARLDVISYYVSAGTNAVLDPGENGLLQLSVKNSSVYPATNIYGELYSLNDLVMIQTEVSYFGNIAAGATALSNNNFAVFARPALIPGMQIPMKLRLHNANGFEQETFFNLPIGTVSQNTPLGPDAYGYLIYDVTDTAFPDCPIYNWIEIHPSLGGSGSQITGFSDSGTNGNEGDQLGSVVLQTIDLPFTFPFYGIDYHQITVCVNGFIAMGITEDGEFRNSRLPGGQGPSPMIAAFWDDLIILSDGGIYRYYDAAQHIFIIQFHKLKNGYNRTSEETFQVIFYDPQFYPTGLGAGMIKIQYKVFNNVDVGGGGSTPIHGNYSTIGIKDHTNRRGLEYSYNNQYAQAAAPLSNQKALIITTVPVLHQNAHIVIGEVIILDANGNAILEPGETAQIGLRLNNVGLNPATNVSLSANCLNPFVVMTNAQSPYADIPGSDSAINQVPISFSIMENCADNTTISIICDIVINGNAWQFPVSFVVKKPSITIAGTYLNDLSGNGNGLADPGETIKLIFNYQNTAPVDARNIISDILCLSDLVTISATQMLLPVIPANCFAQAIYNVTLSNQLSAGTNLTFSLTYQGEMVPPQNVQYVIGIGAGGMEDNFENNNGNYVPSPTTGWQWGVSNYANAHSGTKVWGTLLNSQYPGNVNWTLTSPQVFIGHNVVLEFWHRYATEATYDGGNIKISTNNGSTWNLLTPEGGYSNSYVTALNAPGYSGINTQWTNVRINLSSYANTNARFRWQFATDSIIHGEGWFIDDVKTTGFVSFAGQVTGNVESSNAAVDYQNVLVRTANSFVAPTDTQGNYELYLPLGAHNLAAESPGYIPDLGNNIL